MNKNNNPILTGVGASPGTAQGKVKIISEDFNPEEFILGDVLVTKITDPSMVMIMAKASAIICDIGGITSHPAIVSREMGIPCVVATKNATTKLKDGDEVRVNGTTGEIFLIEHEHNTTTDNDYNDLIEAYRRAFSTMDFDTFKISTDYSKLDPLIANVWIKKILKIINEAKLKKVQYKEIGNLLFSPSTIRNIAIFDLFMASIARLEINQKKNIANFYIKTLKAICLKDLFALNMSNIIHNHKELMKNVLKVKQANPEIAKKLGKLINACYHLSYSLYGDMNPQILYENYGPYHIKGKNGQKYLVVIKEFKNMKPVEIWPEMNKLPFEKITIINVYQNVEFTIDAVTHTNYQGDIINGLKFFAIEVDNKLINIEQVDKIANIIEKFSQFIWSKFKNLDEKQFRILYLYHKSYNYKQLCEQLDIEWRPNQKMAYEITNKPLKEWPKFNNAREADEFFLKIIDPRTDFSG